MKKLSLFSALLCASLFALADPIESEYCGYFGPETKQGDTYITLTWETLDNGDVLITLGAGEGASTCSFRNGGFEGGIDAFVVSTDNFETTTPASEYFTAQKVYSGNTFTLVKVAEVPANAQIKHVGSGHALAWTVNGISAYTFPDFIYTYGGVCASEQVLTDIKFSVLEKFVKLGDEIALSIQPVDQYGLPMDVELTIEVSPADAGSVVDNVFKANKTGLATITVSSGNISNSVSLHVVSSDNLALNKPCEAGYEPENQGELASKANDGNINTQWVTYVNQPADVEWWIVDLEKVYNITAIDVLWGDPYSTQYILQVREDAPSEADKADDEAWVTVSGQEDVTINSEQFIELNAAARFVRLHSLAKSSNFFRLKEVRVFGIDPEGTGVEAVESSATIGESTKILRDGRLLILRDGGTYTVHGVRIH